LKRVGAGGGNPAKKLERAGGPRLVKIGGGFEYCFVPERTSEKEKEDTTKKGGEGYKRKTLSNASTRKVANA